MRFSVLVSVRAVLQNLWIKSQMQNNNSYRCCGLLYLCYSHYKDSIIYLSTFPCFWVLCSSFYWLTLALSLHPLLSLPSCVLLFLFGDYSPSLWINFYFSICFLHCSSPCSISLTGGPPVLGLQALSGAGERLLIPSFSSLSLLLY